MRSLHLEDVVFKQFQLVELALVDLFALQPALIHSHHFEIHDEVLEVADDLLRIDVGTIDHSHLLTLQRIRILDMLRRGYS
jgi:hypothetical protein